VSESAAFEKSAGGLSVALRGSHLGKIREREVWEDPIGSAEALPGQSLRFESIAACGMIEEVGKAPTYTTKT
jgi:hypothetical protein